MITILLLLLLQAVPLLAPQQQVGRPSRDDLSGEKMKAKGGTIAPRGTIAHLATLNWTNTSCTTTKPCQIQVYRAQCNSTTSCPNYPSSSFAAPPTATLTVTVNAGASSTSWIVKDADPAMGDNTTYVWVATNSYSSSPTSYSTASAPWSGTTTAAPAAPPAPTMGTGNTIQ